MTTLTTEGSRRAYVVNVVLVVGQGENAVAYLDLLKQVSPKAKDVSRGSDESGQSADDHDDIDDQTPQVEGLMSSMSSWSFPIAQLHRWLVNGQLHKLPATIPDFPDDLAPYRDRTRLIAFTRQILAAAPWSLTGEERAAQFVAVLAPLIAREAA